MMTEDLTRQEIPVVLPDGTTLGGSGPVVFIGPNGAGKTRFGVTVSRLSDGTRIPALRSLAFSADIPAIPSHHARRQAQNKIQRYAGEFYQQADEINDLLAELKAEAADEAVKFRDRWIAANGNAEPTPTQLDKFLRIWHETFPGRTLDFSTYQPKARSTLPGASSSGEYGAQAMSDGERAAVYLINRVLRAPAGVLVVDEPEVHFHALLARTFWDNLEVERPDCRFVYVTHDLPFALSRRNAEIGIVKSSKKAQILDGGMGIPPDLVQEVLGAASLSLVATRIVFTEGLPGVSIDSDFYGSWFLAPDTAVVPLGSCRAVREAVRVFQQGIVANAEPLGIVERDYFPTGFLDKLAEADGLFVLPTHELEGLLSLPEVAAAVARHHALSDAEFQTRYGEFEAEVRTVFAGGRLHKHLVERIRSDIDGKLDGIMSAHPIDADAAALKTSIMNSLEQKFAAVDAGAIFDEQLELLEEALKGGPIEFLRVLPGKDCLKILVNKLKIPREMYLNPIYAALRQQDGREDARFKRLKADLVAALAPLLPSREGP